MDIAKPIGSEISNVEFSFLSDEEIRSLSVKQITNPQVFDNLGHPIANGLYDLSLGAFLRNICATCGLDEKNGCPGHQGHIELPVSVYNTLFFTQMFNFLRSSCVHCHRFKLHRLETHLFQCKLALLQHGLITECDELENITFNSVLNNQDNSNEAIEDNRFRDDEDENDEDIKNGDDTEAKGKDDASINDLIALREDFVVQAIAENSKYHTSSPLSSIVLEERKDVIKSLYSRLLSRPKCQNCKMYSPSYRKDGIVKIFEKPLNEKQITTNNIVGLKNSNVSTNKSTQSSRQNSTKYLLCSEIQSLLNSVFANEAGLLDVLFKAAPSKSKIKITADVFFKSTLVVPPTRFRLPSKLGDEIHENSINELLSKVLKTCLLIKSINTEIINAKSKDSTHTTESKKLLFNRLMNAFVTIQNDVNVFIDSTKDQQSSANRANATPGIKQALEKKEGLFRKHMMGKRVNYAARSVISPDPMLETNQVGVPPVFAKKLSFPEPVTAYNINELRQAVINGPDVWPGALQVQNEDGTLVSLIGMSKDQRKALADQLLTPATTNSVINKKVFRHLKNDDMVIMNRQPTLHKASMMGHRVKVLPSEKTLRIHYANTGAYNADFDGDEMNMHFPQSKMAQAEAKFIASTNSQYLTPTAGSPVRGLIQDHISAGVWVTNKDTFFTREQMQEYVYSCLRPEDGHTVGKRILTLPPTIWKPVPLWTGKQLISTIMLNITPKGMPGINLRSKNKIKNEYWSKNSEENTVLFKDGHLLCGILDKSQYGASKYGFVHAVHELYGADTAGSLLSVLGRLFTNYIQATAFTCGMEDIYLTAEGNTARKDILKQSVDVGKEAAVEVTQLDKPSESVKDNDPELLRRLEEIIRDDNKLAVLDAINQSKVEKITSKVISTLIPKFTGKKFPRNAMQSMALSGAKGSQVNVSQIMCLLGQQSLEGRRVPLMVSGKSLPCFKPYETDARAGGYIKNRFYSGVRPQEYYFHCMAGREGLIDTAVKTARSGYLQRCLIKQLEGIHVAYDNSVRDSDGTMIQFLYGGDSLDTVQESYLKKFDFCMENSDTLKKLYNPAALADSLNIEDAPKYGKKIKKFYKKHFNSTYDKIKHYEDPVKYDPIISKYNPSKYLGSVGTKFQEDLKDFIKTNSGAFSSKDAKISDSGFEALMHLKYMKSLVHPGEAVGIIAAESIGEPSTQMTLNTFHFAGHGAANVTLGIPRLREIVMTASASIKTPQMYLPILNDVTDEQAEIFCKSMAKIKFSEVVDYVEVVESTGSSASSFRTYDINIKFFKQAEYDEEYNVSKGELELSTSTRFLYHLESAIRAELSNQKKKGHVASLEIGKAVEKSLQEPVATSITVNDNEDDGADAEIMNAKTKEAVSYDEPDEEEVEIMREAEKSDNDDYNDVEMKESDDSSDDDEDNDMKMQEISRNFADMDEDALHRQNQIISSFNYISKYNFDDDNGEWCSFTLRLPSDTQKILMVDLVEETCRKVVVREIPKISRCIYPRPEGAVRCLTTEGVNFQAIFEEDEIVDINGITSNDIAAVLKTYGVEAARNSIVSEVNKVFATYAISVSARHLDLIADYMTRDGTYLAFNRQGIDSSTSSFKKMSYETTCQFITKAVLNNEREQLDSPSARIVIGNLSNVGTGSFDVLTKMPINFED